ncbi:ThiF family adenylyltransferase [Streptomyces wuyuanensis]|uniref:ThiF family adenylyltransferase n=1 Tax=Streptomyces wuyuanensis TaxID=1196353 RepID=UPI003822707C
MQGAPGSWGQATQDDLARLHVGVVGCGSVGMLVVEALARTGIQRLSLFDFDTVEEHNLDRLLHATIRDVRLHRAKTDLAARTSRCAATAADFGAMPYELSVVEPDGFRRRSRLRRDLLLRRPALAPRRPQPPRPRPSHPRRRRWHRGRRPRRTPARRRMARPRRGPRPRLHGMPGPVRPRPRPSRTRRLPRRPRLHHRPARDHPLLRKENVFSLLHQRRGSAADPVRHHDDRAGRHRRHRRPPVPPDHRHPRPPAVVRAAPPCSPAKLCRRRGRRRSPPSAPDPFLGGCPGCIGKSGAAGMSLSCRGSPCDCGRSSPAWWPCEAAVVPGPGRGG